MKPKELEKRAKFYNFPRRKCSKNNDKPFEYIW